MAAAPQRRHTCLGIYLCSVYVSLSLYMCVLFHHARNGCLQHQSHALKRDADSIRARNVYVLYVFVRTRFCMCDNVAIAQHVSIRVQLSQKCCLYGSSVSCTYKHMHICLFHFSFLYCFDPVTQNTKTFVVRNRTH